MTLTALTVTAALLLLAGWLLLTRHRRLRRQLDAAPRIAAARADLTDATRTWAELTARAAATLAAHTAAPARGFGDGHVIGARLRVALAKITADQAGQDQP